jgi:hypothetical protein
VKAGTFAFFVTAALFACSAQADDVTADLACKLHHGVSEVNAFSKLPPPIAKFVLARTGEMAERDQFFNATDVIVKPAPMHRFIRAGHTGDRWFVWFERGGIAYSKNIVVFDLTAGQNQPRLVRHIRYFRENPCALTDAALDSAPMPADAGSEW